MGMERQSASAARNGSPKNQETKRGTPSPPKLSPLCAPPEAEKDLLSHFSKIQQVRERPLFVLVSDHIDEEVCEEVYRWRKVLKLASVNDDLDILIHSPGGDLTACYRTARLFSQYTNAWEALVPGYAASGATLICLGSSNIVLSDIAQLGPLDPQVISKRDTKFFSVERQSPLEAFQAVKYLRESSLTMLDTSMIFLIKHQIAPQHALESAGRLAVQLMQPILGKIDPYDLGAFDLDSSLSKDYCRRICNPVDKRKRTQRTANYQSLVEKYPAHEFVIDREEARALGLIVCEPPEILADIFDELRPHLEKVDSFIGLIPAMKESHHEKGATDPSRAPTETLES
jgi:hypothetical protein